MNEFCPGKYAGLVDRMLTLVPSTVENHGRSPWVEMVAAIDAIVLLSRQVQSFEQDAALTELARLGQEIEGEQEKRDREIRNKALEEAAELAALTADPMPK